MDTYQAAQIVYMRVGNDESPVGIGGFQTVRYTKSLIDPDLLDEIESHFRFDPLSSGEGQFVFNRVGKNQLLLAQLCAAETVDDCGRGGNFIAHGLVFTTEQFQAVGGNPIEIIRTLSFLNCPQQAAVQGDRKAGTIEPLMLATSQFPRAVPPNVAASWPNEELTKLMLLAVNVEILQRNRASAVLFGPTADMIDTLDLLYTVLPTHLRPKLSFETHGQQTPKGRVWAQGHRQNPGRAGDYEVDLRLHTADALDERGSSFGRWVSYTMIRAGIPQIVDRGEAAWWLAALIDSSHSVDPRVDDAELAEKVWRANEPAAKQRLLRVYEQKIGNVLAARVLPKLISATAPLERFEQIAAGGNEKAAAGALHQAYCEMQESPTTGERQDLQEFANRIPDKRLAAWVLIWKKKWPVLTDRLWHLTDVEYAQFTADLAAARYLDVLRLFVPGRGREFLAAVKSSVATGDVGLPELVRLLLEHDETQLTTHLLPMLSTQTPAAIERLHRLTSRMRRHLPERFVVAIEHAQRGQRSADRSQAGWFFQWFR